MADQCFNQIVKKTPHARIVETIEVPDQPTLEDVGGDPAQKVVEGLKKVHLNPDDPERYFLIGENLAEQDE